MEPGRFDRLTSVGGGGCVGLSGFLKKYIIFSLNFGIAFFDRFEYNTCNKTHHA